MITYSQYKQDYFVDKYFNGKSNGFFLDIGAHDGESLSNTLFFEKHRDWKGICIEPIPDVFEKLKNVRNCECINACISEKEGEVTFRRIHGYAEMLSGILDFMTEEHKKRIEHEVKLSKGSYEDITVKSLNINNVLRERGIGNIDYLSIDTEGAEFEIIKTIDFKSVNITLLTVENNENSKEIRNYLKKQGYNYLSFWTDDFFINSKVSIAYRISIKRFILNKLWNGKYTFIQKLKKTIKFILIN